MKETSHYYEAINIREAIHMDYVPVFPGNKHWFHDQETELRYNTALSGSYVFVLELENGHYYIENTRHLQHRLQAHFNGRGNRWTLLHRPRAVIDICAGNEVVANCKAIELALRHGMNKVRGCLWSRVNIFN